MNILQLLTEGIGERTLFHYTNYSKLIKILQSGHLKTSLYAGGKGKHQLATVRPSSTANEAQISALSGATDGGVKFIITADKLVGNNKVPGARIEPIAEYPVSYKENVGDFSGLKGAELTTFITKLGKAIKKIEIDLDLDYENANIMQKSKMMDALKEIKPFNKMNIKSLERIVNQQQMHRITSGGGKFTEKGEKKDKKFHREGEERITFKKQQNVPLDNKYIQISLGKMVKFDRELTPEKQLELITLIKKNRTLFTTMPKGETTIVDDILGKRKEILKKKNNED